MIASSRRLTAFAFLALSVPLLRLSALPPEEAAAGRKIAHRCADAIVNVEVVARVTIAIGAHATTPREGRFETNGTVVTPEGLTLTSLSQIDPRGAAESAVHGLVLPDGQQAKVAETQFLDVKLRLADGTALPARIVRTDRDLDLAFLAPLAQPGQAPRKFACLPLVNAAEPVLLANYFVVSRGPASLERVVEVHAATLEAVVESPHRAFLPSGSVAGCPMLDSSGRLLGICLAQIVDGRPNLVNGRSSSIVLPTAAVAEVARPLAALVRQPALDSALALAIRR